MADRNASPTSPMLLTTAAILAVMAGLVAGPGTGGAGRTPSPGADATAGATAAGSREPTASRNDPSRAFQEFWEFADDGEGKELADELRRRTNIEPEFLIATVPDPIDSRFGYRFDSVVDDIQMAIESQDWNLDRYWLPWRPAGDQPRERDTIKPVYEPAPEPARGFSLEGPDPGRPLLSGRYGELVRGAPASTSALHEREPGVLLFRKPRYSREARQQDPDDRQRLLAVFLVGERPTSGISKIALGKALNVIDRVRRGARLRALSRLGASALDLAFTHSAFAVPGVAGVEVVWAPLVLARPRFAGLGTSVADVVSGPIVFDIIGPFFTGSERSLSAVIADWTGRRLGLIRTPTARTVARWFDPRWRFNVRTGSSNQIDVDQFLKDCKHDPDGSVLVRFDATLHPFDRILDELFQFLLHRNGGWMLGKVALLSESDTEFGNKIDFSRWEKQLGTKITQMRYPFHVAQLAVAIDRSRRSDAAPVPTLARPSSRLRIPFDETGSPRDVVPSLSPRMTAASDEFDLAKILETISTENFRYVGIVASDTRDAIFLSGLIREYCPDVQMFMTSGDLLLGHPDYTGQLRGTVVASPYPLFSMAQRWDPPHEGDRRRHLFMHESDQGYFNATVSIIGRRENRRLEDRQETDELRAKQFYRFMYDYGRPFDEMDLLKPPCERPRSIEDFIPPVWVGVIGERGLWPVTFRTLDRVEARNEPFLFRLEKPEYPAPERPCEVPGKLAPLVPQFSWVWGALALGLSGLAWWTLHAHWRLALDLVRLGGLSDKLRLMPPVSGKRSPLWASQEGFVAAALAILALVYGYFVVVPCRLTLRHSPWSYFLRQYLKGETPFPWGDYWNWQFGLIAIVVCGASFASMAAAAGLRLYLAYRNTKKTRRDRITITVGLGALAGGVLGIESGPALTPGWRTVELIGVLFMAASLFFFLLTGLTQRLLKDARLVFIPVLVALLALLIGIVAAPPFDEEHVGVRSFEEARSALIVQAVDALILGLAVGSTLALAMSRSWLSGVVDRARKEFEDAEERLKSHAHRRPQHIPASEARRACWMAWLKKKALDGCLKLHAGAALAGVPLAAGLAILFAEVSLSAPQPPYDSLLYLERAMILGNGVTPLAPVLLLGITALAWVASQLRRVAYVDRFWIDRIADPKMMPLELKVDERPGLEAVKKRKERMGAAGKRVRVLLHSPVPGALFRSPGAWAAVGLTALFAVRLYERFISTVDGLTFSRASVAAFGFLALTVVLSLCRVALVWSNIRMLLREFAQIPMQRAFDRIPRSLSRQFGPYLNAMPPRLPNMEVHVRQWARVVSDYDADAVGRSLFGKDVGAHKIDLAELAEQIKGVSPVASAHETGAEASERILRTFEAECIHPVKSVRLSQSAVRLGIRKATAACLTVLIPYWATRSLDDGYGESSKEKGAGATDKPGAGPAPTATPGAATAAMAAPPGKPATAAGGRAGAPGRKSIRPHPYEDARFLHWVEQAEDLVALELVHFVSECMIHLKNLTLFLTFSPLLLLLAAACYPYQPGQFLITCLWVLLCVVGVTLVSVYVQMERDEVLSRVAKSSPDRISFNWTFLTQVTAVAVPLVASALARFPFFSDTFNQWLDPIFRILK